MVVISPSILSADLSHLQQEVDAIGQYADAIHVDVMDGHFVPNLSFGAPVLKDLTTNLPLDVHLMVLNPADRIDEFVAVGASSITFHAEVTHASQREEIIASLHEKGLKAGLAINPDTPLSGVFDQLSSIDMLLIMSVFPGFSGQAFIPEVLEKVREARNLYPELSIQIDGGVKDSNAQACREAGCTNLVAASFIFGSADYAEAIAALRG